ncbi:MAG: hypothetical protein Q7S09_01930 [bacterium]|nr:hypothetical protein [bacterium]
MHQEYIKDKAIIVRNNGFTIMEILVVIGISMLIGATVLTSYRRVGSVGSMERAANKLAQDIRTAQALALSSDPTQFGGLPPCGFGIHAPNPATGDPNSYILYTKIPSSTSVPCGVNLSRYSRQWKGQRECFDNTNNPASCPATSYVSTTTVKSFLLPEAGKVRFVLGAVLDDVYFEPPDPATFVLHVADPTASSTLSYTDFPLEFSDNTAILRQIRVSSSGRIEIRSGQVLSKPCVPFFCANIVSGGAVCGYWSNGCGGTIACGIGGLCANDALGDICCTVPGCPGPTAIGQCYPSVPADPSGLSALPLSVSEIKISWIDNAVNEANFEIVRMAPGCASTLQTIIVSANTGTYTDTGLSAETTYCYKVRATNATGPSGYSNTASTLTSPPAPLWTSANASSRKVFLNWGGNFPSIATESSFELQRSTLVAPGTCDVTAVFSSLVTTPQDDTNYNDCDATRYPSPPGPGCPPDSQSPLGVTPNTLYCYRVRAINASGPSAWAYREANSKTEDEAPYPPLLAIPVVVSDTRINLSWHDIAADSPTSGKFKVATSFIIRRCTGSACTPVDTTLTYTGTSPDFTASDTTLSEGTTYGYCIIGQNASWPYSSSCSNTLYATTYAGAPTNLQALPAPTSSGTGSGATSQVNLQWTNPPLSTIQNVKIERFNGALCSGAPAVSTLIGTGTPGPQPGSYIDVMSPATRPKTAYAYWVKAVNATGDSAPSNCVTFTTPDVVPKTPTLNTPPTVVSSTRIDLFWLSNFTDTWGVPTAFRVIRCSGAACNPASSGAQVGADIGGSTFTYADTSVTEGNAYQYCIKAVDAIGVSTCSNASGNVFTPPNTPSILATTTSTGFTAAQINWQDNSLGEMNTYLERGDANCSAVSFAVVATIAGTATTGARSITDSGLSQEAKYCYRMRAATTGAYSSYSSTFSLRTWLLAPSGLSFTTGPGKKINLFWTDNSVNNTGYKIERCTVIGPSCSNFTELINITNQTSYSDNIGNTPGGTFACYRLRATTPEVDSSYGSSACIAAP